MTWSEPCLGLIVILNWHELPWRIPSRWGCGRDRGPRIRTIWCPWKRASGNSLPAKIGKLNSCNNEADILPKNLFTLASVRCSSMGQLLTRPSSRGQILTNGKMRRHLESGRSFMKMRTEITWELGHRILPSTHTAVPEPNLLLWSGAEKDGGLRFWINIWSYKKLLSKSSFPISKVRDFYVISKKKILHLSWSDP